MNKISVIIPEKIGKISPEIYGHFTEHIGGVFYDGLWVGEESSVPNIKGFRKDLIDLLRKIKPPVIRWPGGCFAETYNWRDGIGPREKRPTTVNWWYNSDKKLETNQVGTHEFVEFCRLVGAEPYFAANVSSIPPLETRNWIEYCNFPEDSTSLAALRGENGAAEPFNISYWGIGNENWGGGGNMTPDDYCTQYRKVGTIVTSLDEQLYLIACGPNNNDLDWTRRFFEKWRDIAAGHPTDTQINGYSIHYYCHNDHDPLTFSRDEWYDNLSRAAYMETIIKQQSAVIETYAPDVKLIIDEWGNWHPDGSGPSNGENLFEQQSTMRDALVAAITLNIFNKHCDKIAMANVAQLVNNLHSLFLASGDKLTVTPNYYVFDMFKGHQDGQAVKTIVDSQKISFLDEGREEETSLIDCSASIKNNLLTLTITNSHLYKAQEVAIDFLGNRINSIKRYLELKADDPHHFNTFEEPDRISPEERTAKYTGSGADMKITLPAASVTLLELELSS